MVSGFWQLALVRQRFVTFLRLMLSIFTILQKRRNIKSMRIVLGLIAVLLLLVESGDAAKSSGMATVTMPAKVSASSAPKARVDFDTQIQPIFKSKCMPCHFTGGQMYDRLPFDKPDTIRKLGTRLFTRIKEEKDRRMIEAFLTQSTR